MSHVEAVARSAGRMGRVLEVLVLEALAFRELGDSERAILALDECLKLSQPEGYIRLFLDEGRPMQMLLGQWLVHSAASPVREYALRLRSEFERAQAGVAAVPGSAPVPGDLVEQLTPRELEVLQLMATGATNQEIAGQLVVSRGTVKAHTASIYRKLDVANRTEAVARARLLGILS